MNFHSVLTETQIILSKKKKLIRCFIPLNHNNVVRWDKSEANIYTWHQLSEGTSSLPASGSLFQLLI